MAYADELIEHAFALAERNLPNEPNQADLRRAVSAAYYALFHLLTIEAAENWKHEYQVRIWAENRHDELAQEYLFDLMGSSRY
jgi:uncharacterized protein (UPF0332 family)